MTRTGDREIGVVSGRLPDNPGELACMKFTVCTMMSTYSLETFNFYRISSFFFMGLQIFLYQGLAGLLLGCSALPSSVW